MVIGGWQKFSLNEYPGQTCAILFTQGCNFRCPYCHNPELVLADQYQQPVPLSTIWQFLQNRQDKLDAVSITGGEPTLHSDLISFIKKIKNLGFLIKLDSNGTNPAMLKQLVKDDCVDYFAMDIKAPLPKYQQIVQQPVCTTDIQTSIDLIIDSGKDHEFRTTIVKSLLDKQDLLEIGQTLQDAQRYFLQQFRPGKLIDNNLKTAQSYSKSELNKLAQQLTTYVGHCQVR